MKVVFMSNEQSMDFPWDFILGKSENVRVLRDGNLCTNYWCLAGMINSCRNDMAKVTGWSRPNLHRIIFIRFLSSYLKLSRKSSTANFPPSSIFPLSFQFLRGRSWLLPAISADMCRHEMAKARTKTRKWNLGWKKFSSFSLPLLRSYYVLFYSIDFFFSSFYLLFALSFSYINIDKEAPENKKEAASETLSKHKDFMCH